MLIGNLGKEPEIRYTSGNTAMTKFSIATTERYKNNVGELQERTDWHNIVTWGKTAEFCNEYLKKGSKIYAEGSLRVREWETSQGEKRKIYEVNTLNIILLDRQNKMNNDSHSLSKNTTSNDNKTDINNLDKDEDDLPF